MNLLGGQGSGDGTITPEMLAWIGFVQRDYSDQTLRDFTFNVAGDLAHLPAGPLAFAAGFEHREQNGRFTPDPVVAAGDTAGNAAEPTAGGHRSNEWYGELEVPLFAGSASPSRSAARINAVDLAIALRHFRYDTFGADDTARVGLSWRPTASLLFQASWAQGFGHPTSGSCSAAGRAWMR